MNYIYETRKIGEIVTCKLNQQYFLPAIQRPYVWEVEQIEKLFDSLMKEYPINTFLIWNPPMEDKDKWHTYRFVQHFKQGEISNEEADLSNTSEIHLVLDGQQRLTSLFIALSGSYRVLKKYKRKHMEKSYVRQELYLNLLKNADEEQTAEEEVEGVTYGFQFIDPDRVRNSREEYWFRVSDILCIRNSDKLEDKIDDLGDALDRIGVTGDGKKVARKNLRRLHTVIWNESAISLCVVKQSTYDEVLDIFVRANDGGTKLSKSDLLMSLVTLNWKDFNARDELVTLLNEINFDLPLRNNFDRDFILRSALLFCGQKYVFKVDSFTRDNLEHIQDNWIQVKKALNRAIALVNSFGISNSKGNLTSNNSIMPIAYYVFVLLKKHGSDDVLNTILMRNKRKIRIWLVSSLFSGVFAGAGDMTVVKATRIIREQLERSNDYPAYELASGLSYRRKNVLFDEERIEEFMSLSQKDRIHRICLQMLYKQDEWESDSRMREYVFDPSLNRRVEGSADHDDQLHQVGNMVLLDQVESVELKALGSEEWLATRTPFQRMEHHLPDSQQCDFDDFESVIAARKKLIASYLNSIFSPNESKQIFA